MEARLSQMHVCLGAWAWDGGRWELSLADKSVICWEKTFLTETNNTRTLSTCKITANLESWSRIQWRKETFVVKTVAKEAAGLYWGLYLVVRSLRKPCPDQNAIKKFILHGFKTLYQYQKVFLRLKDPHSTDGFKPYYYHLPEIERGNGAAELRMGLIVRGA